MREKKQNKENTTHWLIKNDWMTFFNMRQKISKNYFQNIFKKTMANSYYSKVYSKGLNERSDPSGQSEIWIVKLKFSWDLIFIWQFNGFLLESNRSVCSKNNLENCKNMITLLSFYHKTNKSKN